MNEVITARRTELLELARSGWMVFDVEIEDIGIIVYKLRRKQCAEAYKMHK